MCTKESSLETLKLLRTDFDSLESTVPVFSTFSHFRALSRDCFPVIVDDHVWVGCFDGKHIHILCVEKCKRIRPIQFLSRKSADECLSSIFTLHNECGVDGDLLNLNVFRDSNPNQHKSKVTTQH